MHVTTNNWKLCGFSNQVLPRDADEDNVMMLTDRELIVEFNQSGNKIFTTNDWRDDDEGLRKRQNVLKQRGYFIFVLHCYVLFIFSQHIFIKENI